MAGPAAQAFWLAAPVVVAGVLHMVAVKRDLWPALRRPVDGGRTFRGKPLFGPNKTWRGFVFMTAAASLLGALQGLTAGAWAAGRGLACMDFGQVGSAFAAEGRAALAAGYATVGALLGFGYALGELPNSFVKRRWAVPPGKTVTGRRGAIFLVMDQADSVVAPLVLGAVVFGYPWRVALHGILWLTLLHLGLNALLYRLRVRREL